MEKFVSSERPVFRLVRLEERKCVFGLSGQLRIPVFGVPPALPDQRKGSFR
jgi:hypothetical protein